jgi:hypothetical protein
LNSPRRHEQQEEPAPSEARGHEGPKKIATALQKQQRSKKTKHNSNDFPSDERRIVGVLRDLRTFVVKKRKDPCFG